MKRALLTRMASGHWLATFKTAGKITGTRVVGGPNDKAGDVRSHVLRNFGMDVVGVRSDAIDPTDTYDGPIVWAKH